MSSSKESYAQLAAYSVIDYKRKPNSAVRLRIGLERL